MAERVFVGGLEKGIIWQKQPACLQVKFSPRFARVRLQLDGNITDNTRYLMRQMARRMLGLTQNVQAFESVWNTHPELGPLLTRNAGLRVPLTATPFEALCWAVIGQQISVHAAIAIRRRVIAALGRRHSGGLYCFPAPAQFSRASEASLLNTGLSRAKARTLQALGDLAGSTGELTDAVVGSLNLNRLQRELLAVPGIGPWTVSYALLRGFGELDGSLHGDVVVRRSLQRLLQCSDPLTPKETEVWLSAFSPWRALVAAHLWQLEADVDF